MVFKKDPMKLKKKYKIHTIHKDIKKLKYVKTIKMYKILTQIHLNYKFKKITFKNNQIHGLSDCLAKGVKILDGMKFTHACSVRVGRYIILHLHVMAFLPNLLHKQTYGTLKGKCIDSRSHLHWCFSWSRHPCIILAKCHACRLKTMISCLLRPVFQFLMPGKNVWAIAALTVSFWTPGTLRIKMSCL